MQRPPDAGPPWLRSKGLAEARLGTPCSGQTSPPPVLGSPCAASSGARCVCQSRPAAGAGKTSCSWLLKTRAGAAQSIDCVCQRLTSAHSLPLSFRGTPHAPPPSFPPFSEASGAES